jgi:formate-dependent nitrite reductase membrane component NrfD
MPPHTENALAIASSIVVCPRVSRVRLHAGVAWGARLARKFSGGASIVTVAVPLLSKCEHADGWQHRRLSVVGIVKCGLSVVTG